MSPFKQVYFAMMFVWHEQPTNRSYYLQQNHLHPISSPNLLSLLHHSKQIILYIIVSPLSKWSELQYRLLITPPHEDPPTPQWFLCRESPGFIKYGSLGYCLHYSHTRNDPCCLNYLLDLPQVPSLTLNLLLLAKPGGCVTKILYPCPPVWVVCPNWVRSLMTLPNKLWNTSQEICFKLGSV